MKKSIALLLLPLLFSASACGLDGATGAKEDGDRNYDAGSDAPYYHDSPTADAPDDSLPPPEEEIEADFRVPQASGRYIYVANSAEDYVVVIDSFSLALEIVGVGKKPTAMATQGLSNAAMVINSGSKDISIIKTAPAVGSTVKNLDGIEWLNTIVNSPAGNGAIAFWDFDFPIEEGEDMPEDSQDVMVVLLDEGNERSVQKVGGYMPREAEFDDSGSKGYIVNKEGGISLVDFTVVEDDEFHLPIIPYPEAIALQTIEKDVDIDPFGSFAMVRLEETFESTSTSVWIMSLKDGTNREIVLPAVPYDLDLSPAGDFAVAVLPTLNQIAVMELPLDPEEPYVLIDVPTVFAGQAHISSDGGLVALFSNQSGEEMIGVYDKDAGTFDVIQLHKTVKTVAFTPDSEILVVIHQKAEGPIEDPTDYEDVADHSYGYSLIGISDGFVKQHLTRANPEPFLVHPDGSRIFLLQRDDALDVRDVEIIYTLSYIVNTIRLGSPPVSIGYVPDSNKIFVSQEHSAGRITFIDESENTQTITGFELNDWIVE